MVPTILSRIFQAGDTQRRITPITQMKGSSTIAAISSSPGR
jgi:hypothetical protein